MYRVEDKYSISPEEFFVLKERLGVIMPSDSNDKNGVGYKISSVYFDDIYDTHYTDTVDGNPVRKKYRIRIYNDSFNMIKLEVKYKQYNRIKKLSRKISYRQMLALINGDTIEYDSDCLEDPITDFNMEIRQRLLRPKVIVTYERKAFVNMAGNVRITFDTGVRASDRVMEFGKKELVYDYPEDINSVLEVKYDEFLPQHIAQTLELNTMWQTSFSKYRICREVYI